MKLILKNNGRENTEIVISEDALLGLRPAVKDYTKIVLITDKGVEASCMKVVEPYLPDAFETIVLEAGESQKTLESAKDILNQLRNFGCDRKSLIIGFGGGVVNDIAGFVASVYMRGIDWIMIPTTLTAQADAAIGSKTGVNLGQYKNMVGSFWPSKAVLIDSRFLKSLPGNHLKNGLAEIIKMGLIYDKQILEYVEKVDPANMLGEELIKASEMAAKDKVEIVNRDMYESGERKLLNFGHTVGHAVEVKASLLHGEAISVGMLAESKLAELEGLTDTGLSDKIADLLATFGLPISCDVASDEILKTLTSDKKNTGGQVNWTLPKSIGEGVFDQVATKANIEQAIKIVSN